MKNPVFTITLAFLSVYSYCQDAIFLHHSVGGNVYEEGNVDSWLSDYNSQNGSDIDLTARAYPSSPYPWDNYPYDYWNIWSNEDCNNSEPGQECLSSLADDYDIIVFKHCYGVSAIEENLGTPDIASARRSLENYILQYRALRNTIDNYPDTKFILWTLTPQHRLRTNSEDAARSKQFVNWVKNVWLVEDATSHDNIFIFDFWSLLAETNESPEQGETNCLKYIYERDHDNKDSHPNIFANQTIGPIFAQFLVDVAKNNIPTTNESIKDNNDFCYPNPTYGEINISTAEYENADIKVIDVLGNVVYNSAIEKNSEIFQLNLSGNLPGIYQIRINAGNEQVYTNKIILIN